MKKQSPKLQFAMDWLTDHPRDLYTTGRDLERRVRMSEVQTVSYKTWCEAKRLLTTPNFNDLETLEERHTVIINTHELTITYQGVNTRVVRKRTHDALMQSYQLIKAAGYCESKPLPGVRIMTLPKLSIIQLFGDAQKEAV